MEETSTWAAAHPHSVRPLHSPWLSLVLRTLEFFRPVREALAVLSLVPRPGEIVLLVPEDAWSILEETLQMDSLSTMFDAPLRRDIAKALKAVRRVHLEEVRDV